MKKITIAIDGHSSCGKINEAKFKKWMEKKEIEDEKKAREEYDELVKSIRAEREKKVVESKES